MNDSNEILEVVRRVLTTQCKVTTPIEPTLRLAEDLKLDSVGMLTLMLELENHYQQNLSDQPDRPPRTVGEVVALVQTEIKLGQG